MSKKILYCASTISHIVNFHLPYLKAFHEQGYEVWVGTNEQKPIPYADHVVAVPFRKKITSIQNFKAIHMARELIKKEKFDIVSTHTMLASAVIRAAILPLHRRPKVFCTVHGYLFNENDGLKKWRYLLPEKICAHVTDVLMVMNHEDLAIAEKHKLFRGKLHYINGMGIDLTKFPPITGEERAAARAAYGLTESDVAYVYAAEFSRRKNQAFLIHAFAEGCRSDIHKRLFLAGEGALFENCKRLVKELNVEDRVYFLGFISDIRQLYAACDVCVSTSLVEGLPFNVMEAIACGLPVIASAIKGHRELLQSSELYPAGDLHALAEKMRQAENRSLNAAIQAPEMKNDMEPFDLQRVLPQIMQFYI